ncbi:NAD(P)/FAD-dependent oxidoreductase [Streptomyces sp. NPDC048473]|uniref:NAD(P)/FAD-dependent oxidoreductase n=1 Tax=unclassified Streptomyces TaxID=2593676 RepID=UPI003714B453
MDNTKQHRILILGAGYAGVMSANRLAGKLGSRVDITLVNPIPEFVERIRLHEVAARIGSDSATRHTVRELLHPAVRLRLGTATRIRPGDHEVDCAEPGRQKTWTQSYDELIYAIGSGSPRAAVPGAFEHAHDVSGLDRARALRTALDALPSGKTVLIVGGGTTAIETVTELAVARPGLSLKIVTSSVLGPTLSPKARRYLMNAPAMRNVDTIEQTKVAEVTPAGIGTTDGRSIPADCVIWAASFAVPEVAKDSGLDVDRAGRLTVDSLMRSTQHPDILGAGDGVVIAGPEGSTLRMACGTAVPQGAHAAATIIAGLRGETPKPFALAYLALNMSLGPNDGLVQPTRANDSPREISFTGRFAGWVNELNNRYARLILSWERQRAGSYHWAKPRKNASTPTQRQEHARS